MTANRLANETSPYLLQHQDNPVHWHPWDEAALETAQRENKPILLSVGYAACHWCHVMAHESFENAEIAALMNRHFVNIKVDREERPDLDSIYQSALALLGEHGGWPLTMFLTPKGEPFWGGTYFPPEPRYGRPGFPQILSGIAEVYAREPEKVEKNVAGLGNALAKLSDNLKGGTVSLAQINEMAERLVKECDPVNGGIGQAPKFPQPSILKLFWRAWKRSGQTVFRQAVERALTRMSQGGIYDHLGGGFARYTVDERWLIPHFEKMLYDNAQLIDVLTWAWQESESPLFEQRVRETVDWLLRDMMAQESENSDSKVDAFASTLDADSEGEEGKFYVWQESEVDEVLKEASPAFKAVYDVSAVGNWEGKNILNRLRDTAILSASEEKELKSARDKLFDRRKDRIHPGWDDKVLADWNGLMIAALARAGRAFKEPDWVAAAEKALAFVQETMMPEGRLHHSWRRGHLKHAATLDDYANLTDAALALYQVTGKNTYLDQAESWCQTTDRHYWDHRDGGYFFTADDAKDLILRSKSAHDNAVPSGNGTMVAVLTQLFHLTGNDAYRERAEQLVTSFTGELERNFFPLSTLLNGAEFLQSSQQLVIVKRPNSNDEEVFIDVLRDLSLPNAVFQVISGDESLPETHPAHGKGLVDGKPAVYLCQNQSCSLPMTDANAVLLALKGNAV
ncbi:thioredoxin domain-containing protein [Denitrobaculum tricleocarpae]|uniref:Thioredoxin domain-containing protein n=2 Tax=Denitrobaculum tricleocarpae TaxID=2591009 RepID=A0A545TRY5_9PROT|nr:thioredoxin domain-containing protein [Denitrobaculum tricleocarpae]TQV79976.1 thioredoxin domain-containing protein [Denitrobaculum tricleocarpae]